MRPLKSLILLAIILAALALWNRHGETPQPRVAPTPSAPGQTAIANPPADMLPPEAHDTLGRIARGGPFEHDQDGAVFGNYEGLLPKQPRGYYHEYTVETPGARNRGARRIITGGTPPVMWYYTDDHYRSFRRLETGR